MVRVGLLVGAVTPRLASHEPAVGRVVLGESPAVVHDLQVPGHRGVGGLDEAVPHLQGLLAGGLPGLLLHLPGEGDAVGVSPPALQDLRQLVTVDGAGRGGDSVLGHG